MITIPELQIHYVERADHRNYGETELSPSEPPTLYGYNEIYKINNLWFAYEETDGGSSLSVGYQTREEAETSLRERAERTQAFWDEKVEWLRNGDRATSRLRQGYSLRTAGSYGHGADSSQVIRCSGVHYTIGQEPTEDELRGSRLGIGYAGARFSFQLLTGEVIHSRNVWYQGQIPVEYRELLPDNAVSLPQEQVRSWQS